MHLDDNKVSNDDVNYCFLGRQPFCSIQTAQQFFWGVQVKQANLLFIIQCLLEYRNSFRSFCSGNLTLMSTAPTVEFWSKVVLYSLI